MCAYGGGVHCAGVCVCVCVCVYEYECALVHFMLLTGLCLLPCQESGFGSLSFFDAE